MFKFENASAYGMEAMDTFLKGYSTAAKGFQAIVSETSEYSKKTYEANVAHAEALMGVRSIEAAVELNTSFARSMVEGYMAELNKLGEMYSDLARQSYAPVQAAAAAAPQAVKTGVAAAEAA